MNLRNLNEEETDIVKKCLDCVANGRVIFHDFEFQSIMGIEVSELKNIIETWPNIDENNEKVFLAINNSMVNLLGYPHGRHYRWEEYLDVSLEEIASTLEKWRGRNIGSYFSGLE